MKEKVEEGYKKLNVDAMKVDIEDKEWAAIHARGVITGISLTQQSKRHSFLESLANVFSGMIIAFIICQLAHMFEPQIQRYIWAGFEWKLSVGTNLVMTSVLTVVSVIRSYFWRRHFNRRIKYEVN